MNKYFKPENWELECIKQVSNIIREEFTFLRLTKTMLEKSTIDANKQVRVLLKKNNFIDFNDIGQGESYKKRRPTLLFTSDDVYETRTSFYRPETKEGDPRLWVYKLKSYFKEGTIILFFIHSNKFYVVPIMPNRVRHKRLIEVLEKSLNVKDEIYLENILKPIYQKWVPTEFTGQLNPKDIGTLIEKKYFNVQTNSSILADINGEIEVKSKGAKTKASLWSQVPNWELSKIKSAADLIREYGYESRVDKNGKVKHPGFIDLYVTVSKNPNKQGLYFDIYKDGGFDSNILGQYNIEDGRICVWEKDILRDRFFKKLKSCVHIKYKTKFEDNRNHFKIYDSVNFMVKPIFSKLILGIEQGFVVYDWRAKVKPKGIVPSRYKDHGNGFRVSDNKFTELFSSYGKLNL